SAQPEILDHVSLNFNALLDSGCSTHLIWDRRYFWTYDTLGAVNIGTANCGTLVTLAKGEVCFQAHINGKTIIITLPDCLHAPDVPINLLSVGSMTDRNL
ncbi:hypothetical protein C0993_003628, partial [Termitomyces sp. T159_Od127]